jgi:hypothetical protein
MRREKRENSGTDGKELYILLMNTFAILHDVLLSALSTSFHPVTRYQTDILILPLFSS